jgi:predicted permease
METIWHDILYAARGLRRNPLFAATAILTLSLGIGGTTGMFTVIRAVLLKPLEYAQPDQLVLVSGGATSTRFEEMKTGARSFTELAAYSGPESLTLTGGGEPEVLTGFRVSADFLHVLHINPVVGRSFLPAEDAAGAPPVVMISAQLWKRRFGEDPHIAGKTANLAATPYTIIGVLPPRFQFPSPGVDVWITRPSEWSMISTRFRPLSPFLTIFGRMKPGVTLQQANAEMVVIRHQYAQAHPAMLDAKAKPNSPESVTPMKENLVSKVRPILWMLFGAVSFVLMIACANVASLLLARATSREREFAVRAALGAGRARLIGQLLAESVLLSSAGGVIGVLLAAWSLKAIPMLTSFDLPRAAGVRLDWMVLAFAAIISLGTGVLFGLAPSLSASQPDLIGALRGTGAAATKRSPRLSGRGLLVAGQIALSVVLLIGAALMMESVGRLHRVDLGFNPAQLLTANVSLPPTRYDTIQKKAAFYGALLERVKSLPGVRSATVAMFLPMMGYAGSPVQDAGKPPLRLNEKPIATVLVVMPDYFQTLHIPLLRGRDFNERDKDGSPRVAIIDESFARRFWPGYPHGEDPIGQHLLVGSKVEPVEIVGVVRNVHQDFENSAWPEAFYLAFPQYAQASATLAIRTSGDPLTFTGTLRRQVLALDPDQPISAVKTMDELVDEEVGQRRLLVGLLGSFAGVALLLALIGIYGVISYSVTERFHELGIRWALGARQADVLRLVMGEGLALTLAGIAVGIGGAVALTRVMKSVLFEVSPTDPTTFAGIGMLFVLVALAASYIPARRATRIDPMTTLRV